MKSTLNNIVSITLAFTWATCVLAQPKVSNPQPEPNQPQRTFGVHVAPSPEPQPVPTKEDRKREQAFRNSQSLFGPGYQPPQAPAGGPGANPLEMLQHRMHDLQQQQEQLAREYQATVSGAMPVAAGAQQDDPEKRQLRQLLELTQAQLHQAGAPLPPDAELRAFKLQFVRPEDIAQSLHNITGGGGPRIAIDERTNSLLIAGNDKQLNVAEKLVKTLDQPGESQQTKATETLQLRIVWLLDGLPDNVGKAPNERLVSPQVVDALRELGFESPKVVCQQLTTLTLGQENRRGQFHFEIPVLIDSEPWQFQGQGMISPMPDERYALEFDLNVRQPNNPQSSQLGGSIYSPLGHYTVMGTTTFVALSLSNGSGPSPMQKKQHLSAFVVYLDRAREFPDAKAKPKDAGPRTVREKN